ncbi:Gfo/Idh/MocA family oxidoreductase [Iamia sp. SCSIO 61187]|uniref:Gfo/Idh/MocA family protein n=1 Tax=Iamia sp. SCSIO 61187 TaxID=2722752 RepID=UPI001C637396|nr:Gfo/Idh/MocA family oxidoreductase [Iamia sp. SCSIO 61187]QYG92013.1 Gfo/Idh/MocA family oxidoreductase [Iamia sp. SCSIO 61187]
MTPARIGLVGCGRLATVGYAPASRAATGIELVAVADPDHRRRAEVLAAHGGLRSGRVMAFRSAADLLAAVEVDALVLATPAPLHVADAARAVTLGVPVLVEKPPAEDVGGARALAALDPAPWVGFNRRFDAGARAVRDAVPAAGDLHVTLVLSYRRRSWGAHVAHDDALLDLGPHLVDWARWLTGAEVETVTATEVGPERAALELATDRGPVRIWARADGIHREAIDVRDGHGRAVAQHVVGGPLGAVRGRLQRGPHPLVRSLTAQLEALGRAVAGHAEPDLGTAADGVAAMAVIDAARASHATGGEAVAVAPS